MKAKKDEFVCSKCKQGGVHYCRGMCNPCYQRHLRQKHKDRKLKKPAQVNTKKHHNDYTLRSPRVGEQFQADMPTCDCPSQSPNYTKVSSKEEDERREKFLKFCKEMFDETQAEGDIIKGAAGLQERAIELLRTYGDLDKAMYAVLKPVQLLLNPELVNNLPPEDISREVHEAEREIKKNKKDSKEELLEKITRAVEEGITESELQTLLQLATNIKVNVPPEIVERLSEAQKFSSEARKHLKEKSLSFEHLRNLVIESKNYPVQTATMKNLEEVLQNAEEWSSRVAELKSPTLRQLHVLVGEGSRIPIDLKELPQLREKYRNVKKWVESANALVRSWKTRADSRSSISHVESLLKQAEALDFTHNEIGVLRGAMEQVKEWEERLAMIQEDEHNETSIISLLEEAKALPLDVGTIEHRKVTAHWSEKAKRILESEKIPQKVLTQVLNEAKSKSIVSSMVTELQSISDKTKDWREQAKKAISNQSLTEVSCIEKLIEDSGSLKVEVDSAVQQLENKLAKALNFQKVCQEFLKRPQETWKFSEIKSLQRTHSQLGVTCEEYREVKSLLENTQNWNLNAMEFLEKFPRNEPLPEEFNTLRKLIQNCPEVMKNSEELQQLLEMQSKSLEWLKQSKVAIKNSDLDKFKELHEEAKLVPVDFQNFCTIKQNLDRFEWEQCAQQALESRDYEKLCELRNKLDGKTELKEKITQELQKTQNWKMELERVCEEGSKEDLEVLYKQTKQVPVAFKQKETLKKTIMVMELWEERAQEFLCKGGDYAELRSLIKEGELVSMDQKLIEALRSSAESFKEWRKKAKGIINAIPNPPPRQACQSKVFKKRCFFQEYKLESEGNLKEDLLNALEKAPEVEIPSVSYAFPLYHPTEGISLIIRKGKLFPKPKTPFFETKRKRALSYKQRTTDEVKSGKKPPKRPRDLQVPWSTYCVCRNEMNWDDNIMVSCDFCGEWYHPSCILIDVNELEKSEEFACWVCQERAGARTERVKRQVVDLEEFRKTLKKGVPSQELRDLETIAQRVEEWRLNADSLLKQGLEQVSEEQGLLDLWMQKALAEYEALPVVLQERDCLMRLLQKRDWAREALKCIRLKASSRNIKKLLKQGLAFNDPILDSLVSQLEELHSSINYYTNQLHALSSSKAFLQEYKVFLESVPEQFSKFEKFEKLRKKIEQFETILNEVQKTQNGEYLQLYNNLERAKKLNIQHDTLKQLENQLLAVNEWSSRAQQVLSSNDKPKIQQLIQEYRKFNISHPLGLTLQEQLNK